MKQFEALTRKRTIRPVRYLIVDDSVFARKSLAKMVESFGGDVAGEAGDGCTAITEYARTKPDIVLMDITMPQMEGIEAVERIVQEHPEARVVMVSSVGYQDNILAALQKGARHFVQKPVKPDALYEIVRYVLNDDGVVGAGGRRQRRARDEDGSDPAVYRLARRRPGRNDESLRRRSPTSPWKRKAIAAEGSPRSSVSKGKLKGALFWIWSRAQRRRWPAF